MAGVNNAKKTPGRGKGRPFKRGNSGRPKGAKDKISKNTKDNFEAVFKKLGGIDGFYGWAKKNSHTQGAFYQMYSKMLPSNIDVEHRENVIIKVISAVPRSKKGNRKGNRNG